jgi:O-antigen ligase
VDEAGTRIGPHDGHLCQTAGTPADRARGGKGASLIRASTAAIVLLGLSCGLIFLGEDIRIAVRIRAFDLGLLLVSAIFFWHTLTCGVRSGTGPFLLAFGAFAVYIGCNAAMQTSVGTAAKETVQSGLFAVFVLAMVQYLDSWRATSLFLTTMLLTLWILAFWNAGVHIADGEISGWKQLGDQKLTHSVVFVMMAIMTASPLRPKRWWWFALLVLAFVMLILSGERKGWVAAAPAIFLALLVSDWGGIGRRALRRTAAATIGALALLGIVTAIAPNIPYLEKQLSSTVDFVTLLFADPLERGAAVTTESNRGRLVLIEIALQHYHEHPIFGIGQDQFKAATAFFPVDRNAQHDAHNEVLRIAAELGTVGLLLYLVLNLVILQRGVMLALRMAPLDDSERLRVRLGLALFVYGFIVNIFLAGGGLNTYFVMLPAGLLFSVPLRPRLTTQYGWKTASPRPA